MPVLEQTSGAVSCLQVQTQVETWPGEGWTPTAAGPSVCSAAASDRTTSSLSLSPGQSRHFKSHSVITKEVVTPN